MSSAPSPFESLPEEHEQESRPARWMIVAGRRVGVIPSFYQPHADLSLPVRSYEGAPILSQASRPVRIGDVMAERRWAIDGDGRVLRQDLFERQMRIVHEETFGLSAQDGGPDNKPRIPSLEYHHYPEVVAWILTSRDPADPAKHVPMHYDPTPRRKAVPKEYVDASGEAVKDSPDDLIAEAYRDPALRRTLKPHEVARAEEMLGGSIPNREAELEKKIEALLERQTDLEKKIEEGGVGQREFTATAECGKVFYSNTQKRAKHAAKMHIKYCRTCRDGRP